MNVYQLTMNLATGKLSLHDWTLIDKKHTKVVDKLYAEDWFEARELVDTSNMVYRKGYGWFYAN